MDDEVQPARSFGDAPGSNAALSLSILVLVLLWLLLLLLVLL